MMEITSFRNGSVLNHHNGKESKDSLLVQLEGMADADMKICVNGVSALRSGRRYIAPVELRSKFNDIVVIGKNSYGEFQQKINVVWDKASYKRYRFCIDDNIFFLTDIAKNRPKSLFDHFYLRFMREMNRKYGLKVTLNLFYRNDHFAFELKDFPDRYRAEWQDNSDWLKLSFHAYSEFPDRPYQDASGEKLAADYDLIRNEVIRFAGEESFEPPEVVHWGMLRPDNFHVLRERGVRVLGGWYINAKTSLSDGETARRYNDIGFFADMDTSLYLASNRVIYDHESGLFFNRGVLTFNLVPLKQIAEKLEEAFNNQFYSETMGMVTHEQYSYDYYHNYLPDHLERIEEGLRIVTEHGYRAEFFNRGILGNTAWGK